MSSSAASAATIRPPSLASREPSQGLLEADAYAIQPGANGSEPTTPPPELATDATVLLSSSFVAETAPEHQKSPIRDLIIQLLLGG